MAGILGTEQDLSRTGRQPASRSSTCSTCSPTRRAKGCTSATPRATRRPTCLPLSADARLQRAAPDGLGRLRPARRAVRDQDRAPTRGRPPSGTSPTFRRQIKMLGFSYDWDRELATTDSDYMRWTQWIFLVLFDTWYDPEFEWTAADGKPRAGKGGPIAELPIPEAVAGAGRRGGPPLPGLASGWPTRRSRPVNWCPALGHGAGQRRSDRRAIANAATTPSSGCRCGSGCCGSPPMPTGWWRTSTRSTGRSRSRKCSATGSAAAKGPRSISSSARPVASYEAWSAARAASRASREHAGDDAIRVYTTRPDTLFGATYMVLAPEHPLVDRIDDRRAPASEVDAYRRAGRGHERRGPRSPAEAKRAASSPAAMPSIRSTASRIPIWIADYVLISYGTGRDHGRARAR